MIQPSQSSTKSAKPYKIILVGCQAVGKSSLLHRIIQSKFDPHYTPTIGVDFKTIVIPIGYKQIGLQIWDTAGQQKFKALTQTYYRGAHGCICVYDINDKQSLQKAQDYVRDAFQFKIQADCIFLLANKSDKIQQNSYQQKGRQLANRLNINFLKVSAQNGDGVGNLVENLACKIDKFYSNNNQISISEQSNKRPKLRIDQQNNKSSCAC